MENQSNFDLGPLTWVKAEIDNAIQAAATALDAWNGQDTTPLREAATYLHQVSGALQIVDLQGVCQVCNAIEGLLADMQAKTDLRNPDSSRIVLSAIMALRGYLDSLMAGGVNNELLLNPVYAEVQGRRGGEAPSPSDLFHPDLSARVKRISPELPLDGPALARAARPVRARYEKGLLHLLQNRDDQSGLQLMGQAVREIERLAPGAAQYTFWWAAGGVLDALLCSRLTPDIWTKRLLARLDLQMRRLSEGSRQLADRLFGDVLFFLAQDSAVVGRGAEARDLFELDRYRPSHADSVDKKQQKQLGSLQPQLKVLLDTIGITKDQWLRLCAGRQEGPEALRAASMRLLDSVRRLPESPLSGLAEAVMAAADGTSGSVAAAQNEALQLEMAVALLLLQHAAENYFDLSHDFADLAAVQAHRLRDALTGQAMPPLPSDVHLLDEIARQAQEKLLVAQVAREIQTNLNRLEEILDKFFRNQNERADLPLAPGLLKQIQGALDLLQLDTAGQLVEATLGHVAGLVEVEGKVDDNELNWIAEAISTLGLYIDALRNGQDDPAGLRALLAPPAETVPQEASVEQELAASAARVQATVDQLTDATDQAEARGEIKRELSRIAEDADLVGDSELRGQASEVLHLIDQGASAETIQNAVQTLSSSPVAPPAAPPPTASEQEIDAELLQIYVEEAKTVLADMAAGFGRLRASAQEHDAFVDIRRGFHTLKGSGRMVGLTALAEAAWEVEQTLNLWLRDERAINHAILDFVDLAATAFRGWVTELAAKGAVQVRAETLTTQARQLRGEAETAVKPAAPAVTAPVPETPAIEPDKVMVGHHEVAAALFAIFTAESAQRLADLRNHLAEMAETAEAPPWDGFARAAHTLAGIARTTGLTPLADAAHALENWVLGRLVAARPLTETHRDAVSGALDEIADQLQAILERRWPNDLPDLAKRLAALQPEVAEAAKTPVAEQLVERQPQPGEPAPSAAGVSPVVEMPASVPPPTDECDPQLLPIFLTEADELLPRIGESLRRWRAQPDDIEARQSLQRSLHTLKGSARMAGAMALGDGAHGMETAIAELAAANPDDAFMDRLESSYDALAERADSLRPAVSPTTPATPAPATAKGAIAAPPPAAVPPIEASDDLRQDFRAKAGIIDNLINEAGEVSIARARIEAALNHYRLTAQELTANVERLRGQLRELEIQAEAQIGARMSVLDESHFDPLEFDRYTRLQELTRLMAESVNDVSTAQESLLAGLSDAEYALLQQSRTTRNLQQELMHIRMVRLNSQAERLHRIVHQAAKDMQRSARLRIEGGDIELDRTLLDKAMVPFEHLLRNAVAHGIEPAAARRAAGKPEHGAITLTARQEGTEVILTLSDDGAGIDLSRVRARAEALGLLRPGEPAERERLYAFLFMSGFSTSTEVTQVAGRGIGLDVVRSEIASVGGRVRIESEPGQGTRFSIRLPATLALAHGLLAKAGDQIYAIQASMVVLVKEMRDAEWRDALTAASLELDGQSFPLHSLAELTGQLPNPVEGKYRTVLLLRSGDERAALRVDDLNGNAEVVVKTIGPQLSRAPGIAGATVLTDGRVALILNPYALIEQAPARAKEVTKEAQAGQRAPLILVVDDSLTVRKVTSRLLLREGYRVATAKDGIEALEALQDELPAVMLLDIEMPRMDGFEVARHVRAGSHSRDLPIVMITSRTADKHRQHAFDLGVNKYLGKPYQEDELLAAIAGFAAPGS